MVDARTVRPLPIQRDTLRIGLVNLMPDKITTETQFCTATGAGGNRNRTDPAAIAEPVTSRNTCAAHHERFYQPMVRAGQTCDLDGVIVTGAPVEHDGLRQRSTYWSELTNLFDWIERSGTNACPVRICWAAQAALYHYSRRAKA